MLKYEDLQAFLDWCDETNQRVGLVNQADYDKLDLAPEVVEMLVERFNAFEQKHTMKVTGGATGIRVAELEVAPARRKGGGS